MKNSWISTWFVAIMGGILCHQVICASDYQVFHTSGGDNTGLITSDSHDDYEQYGGPKKKEFDLSGYKRISPTPKFTLSHLYISPENAEPHFTRSGSKGGYGDGYSAFLQQHFQGNDGDDDEVNSDYRQKNYDDDDEGVISNYRQKSEASDDHDDEEGVNSKYEENNYDDDDEEVKSNYEHAPIEVEESNRHYYNSNSEFEQNRSLPLKESKQPAKNCKVIVKGKAMCRLCKDPVSGAHSESCSFSSSPPEHKYAYIKKAKYVS